METWSPLPVILWVFALRKPLLLFQGQTPRRPFSTHSKCSTLKAKGCSRLTSEWESVWNIWGTLVCLPTHPMDLNPGFSVCSVQEMLTTQAERFSKEEVQYLWNAPQSSYTVPGPTPLFFLTNIPAPHRISSHLSHTPTQVGANITVIFWMGTLRV